MNPDRLKCQLPSPLVTTHAGMESLCLAAVSLPPSASDTAPPGLPGFFLLGHWAAACCKAHSVPDNRLVERVQPAYHLLSPSLNDLAQILLHSTFPAPKKGKEGQ